MDVLIVDALGRGSGRRVVTVDAIGAGPRTIAGVLEGLGVSVELTVAESVFASPRYLENYSALMISAMSVDSAAVKRLVRLWRRYAGLRPVVIGGPIMNSPVQLVNVGADVGVIGEAEPAIEALVREGLLEDASSIAKDRKMAERLCGLVFNLKGELLITRRCPLLKREEWERYRPSTRVIEGYPRYWASRVYVEVLRGCSNYRIPDIKVLGTLIGKKLRRVVPGCAYCSVIWMWGPVKSRGVEHVYSEVKGLVEHGVRRIVLSGPDILDYGRDWLVEPRPLLDPSHPPANLEALESLFSRLTAIPEVSSGEVAIMAENVKPSLVTEASAQILGKYLKGTPISIGVESGDDRLLKVMGRPSTLRESLRAVELLIKNGLRPHVYIMYCLPGEDSESISRTLKVIDKLYKMGVEKVTAYRYLPIPGSTLGDAIMMARQDSMKCLHPHPVKVEAERVNLKIKRKMIGRILRVIPAGVHPKYGRIVGYPLPHGPAVLLDVKPEGDDVPPSLERRILDVRVTGVVSDHLVEGVVIRH
jgi:radical SAM superfamily enzyme YgiQ (UPF0313 family)